MFCERIRAGARQTTARLAVPAGHGAAFALPGDVRETLGLPDGLRYQLRLQGDTLDVGPVIGLLVSGSHLERRRLRSLGAYTLLYPFFHGVLYAFGAADLDPGKESVRGFYFTGDTAAPWEEAVLPIASAVYRRASAPRDVLERLTGATGGRLFNASFFDKWEFWKMVSGDPALREHIPRTERLESLGKVDQVLGASGATYLKPAAGTMASGVYRVTKEARWYWVDSADTDRAVEVMDRDRFGVFVEGLLKARPYLIQEPVDTLRYEGRMVDFRVVMQKDDTERWGVTGILAKCGAKDGVSSNFREHGFALPFSECMSRLFKMSDSQAFIRYREIADACMYLCQALDRTGQNYGDVGVDVALDRTGKVWLLEVNKRHDHFLPRYINDLQFYYAVKNNPIKYCVALSGFTLSEGVDVQTCPQQSGWEPSRSRKP